MRLKRTVVALATVGIVAAIGGVGQTHQYDPKHCMGTAIVAIPDKNAPVLYVDDDGSGIWFYAESNNHKGLQRGGTHPLLGDLDEDSCDSTHNGSGPDLLVL